MINWADGHATEDHLGSTEDGDEPCAVLASLAGGEEGLTLEQNLRRTNARKESPSRRARGSSSADRAHHPARAKGECVAVDLPHGEL